MKTPQKESEMLAKIEAYVAQVFGPMPISRIPRGTNFCYTLGNPPRYVIKIEGHNPKTQCEAVQLYHDAGIPIAPIIRFDRNPSGFDKAVIVMNYIDHDVNTFPMLPYQAGELLRKMHEIQVEGIGRLYEGKGRDLSWQSYLEQKIRHWTKELEEAGIDQEKYLMSIDQLPTVHTLLHGDFTLHNILIKENKIAAVIDPHGLVGDPMFDVAMSTYPPDIEQNNDFFRGYAREGFTADEQERIKKYRSLIRVHKIGWLSSMLAKKEITDEGRSWFEKRRKSLLDSLEKQK